MKLDASLLPNSSGQAAAATASAVPASESASAAPDPQSAPAVDTDPGPPGHSFKFPLHVNARGAAIGTIATVAFVWALQWAEKFLVPLLLGVFIAYTLSPVVQWLERRRLPRPAGATLVTVAIVCLLGGVGYRVQGEIINVVHELPKVISDGKAGQPSTIAQVQAAARELERATASVAEPGKPAARKAVVAVAAVPSAAPGSNIKVMDWVLAGSMGVATFISQATMVVFLVFFLLLAGDTFKRKLVK